MATLKVFDEFFIHIVRGYHGDMNTQTFGIALTNTAPVKDTSTVLANITQIANGNGYTTATNSAGATVPLTWAETGAGTGIWQLGDASSDCLFTASGGAIATFQYAVLYNRGTTTVANGLIAMLDYGSAVNVTTGNTFNINAGASGWVQFTTPAW
jgi:hypothetical protein